MPNPYSAEMRERVIARVESGASRREAAEHFEISASAAVKWLQRWRHAGSSTARPHGGSTSPLEKQANWLLALIAKQPDLTLDEVLVGRLSCLREMVRPCAATHDGLLDVEVAEVAREDLEHLVRLRRVTALNSQSLDASA